MLCIDWICIGDVLMIVDRVQIRYVHGGCYVLAEVLSSFHRQPQESVPSWGA